MPAESSISTTQPLKGDENGIFRVNIIGNSGTGKSTLGYQLAAILSVPHIALDRVHWSPGWVSMENKEFQDTMKQVIADNPGGWVIDGQYRAVWETIVRPAATDIIWLDPPFLIYFPRLIWRTFGRWFGFTPLCSPGCGENFRAIFLSKESILWWAITQHQPLRRRLAATFDIEAVQNTTKWTRIRGWRYTEDLASWLKAVKAMVRKPGIEGGRAEQVSTPRVH